MPRGLALLAPLALALAGCTAGGGPDARLPGVYTDSAIEDEFTCGALLFPHGCAIVRFPAVHSGCEPEVPGYVACNGTIAWSATAGAAVPGSQLVVRVNGTSAGSCEAPCTLHGNASFDHHFDAAGQRHAWNVSVLATLAAPGAVPEAGGSFRLTAAFVVRTEPPGSLAV